MSRRSLAGAAVALLAAGSITHAPRLVWNASASAPIGLYWVGDGQAPVRGDLVLARTPPAVADLAAKRGYLPLGVPLVKRVAAVSGDRVCTQGDAVVINRSLVALRVGFDRQRRPLPYWEGCRSLDAGEMFLLMRDAPNSFDSRYFGPMRTSSIIGQLVPLWTQ